MTKAEKIIVRNVVYGLDHIEAELRRKLGDASLIDMEILSIADRRAELKDLLA